MNTLQRYIIKELLPPITLSILFFTVLMLLRQLFSLAEILLEARVGWEVFAEVIFIVTVTLTTLTVPMAALLGTLIGLGRLTSENEILAIRVGGVSLWRVFAPLFLLSLVGSGVLLWANMGPLPRLVKQLANKKTQIQFEILTQLEAGRYYDSLAPRGTSMALYFGQNGAPQPGDGKYTLRMERVAIRFQGDLERVAAGTTGGNRDRSAEREMLFFARTGTLIGDLETRSLRLILEDGTVMPIDRTQPAQSAMLRFEKLERTLSPKIDDGGVDAFDLKGMSYDELTKFVAKAPTGDRVDKAGRMGSRWRSYLSGRNELYSRFTLPFSLFAFMLIAVPMAVEIRPRAKSVAFLLALGLIVFYYLIFTWAGAVGMSNSPYALAAFISPNVVIGLIGIFLFWRSQR